MRSQTPRVPKPPITDTSSEWIATLMPDDPGYRVQQILHAVYHLPIDGFDAIRVLPERLRALLEANLAFSSLARITEQQSHDGTRKALFHAADGSAIETVRMPSERGTATTVCVSSQSGCGMGCTFCATGATGLTRNLTAGEIVDQFLHFRRTASREEAPDRLVFMGMGEPLANLRSVEAAVSALVDPNRVGLGARHVTVSTVGLPKGIDEIAGWPWQVGLAISLHAPDDAIRSELVPVNRRFPIVDLMGASLRYQRQTGRRVSYEYTLLAGVNDSESTATALARLLQGQRCHVNLIPFNPFPGARYQPPTSEVARTFRDALRAFGIAATIRRTRGRDISGACGQLHAGQLTSTATARA